LVYPPNQNRAIQKREENMDNRRHSGSTPTSSFSQTRYYKKEGDRDRGGYGGSSNSGGGYRKFQPRNNDRFQSRDDRFQSRDRNERFQPRDRNDRNDRNDRERTNDRFVPRGENRFRGRDDNNRFQPRDRNDKFAPRKPFLPRGKQTDTWKQIPKPRVYDEMQITDGKHRGKFLKSTASPKVRPTARRIREVMFRLIFRRVRAHRFLDLCAGSGAVGIEAISRGALLSTFVERSAKMCSFIRKNMETCGIKEGHGEIHEIEVVPFLKRMQKRRRFWDVVYFDPPYDTNYDEVLEFFKRGVAVRPGGLLVIEHHAEMFFPEFIGVLKRARVITQGDTALSFYERKA
jgi:16S rRNA (guanine966-N2)-methyltransferase